MSWWKKLLIGIAVIVAVVAVAAITVATAGTGSAIAAIAIGAAKGAIVGAVVGAAQGAVIGGVTGYIEGGTAGILSGMVEGAADGFMIGAISGAVTGGYGAGKSLKSPNKALYNASSSKFKAIDKVDDVARVHQKVDVLALMDPTPKKITGYTNHGLNQAISRDGGKGVSPKAILEIFKNSKPKYDIKRDTFVYKNKIGRLVLNRDGKVVTIIGKGSKYYRGVKWWLK